MILTSQQKKAMAQAMVNSRELCGNETEALKQYCDDLNLPFPTTQLGSIQAIANQMWREYQKEAEVNPKHYR